MRYAENRTFKYAPQLVQHVLYFLRVNIIATRYDQVLGSTYDCDPTIAVCGAQVTRNEKPIRPKLLGRLFRHIPVPLENVASPNLNHPNLTGRERSASFRICDPDLYARKRIANSTRDPFTIVRI